MGNSYRFLGRVEFGGACGNLARIYVLSLVDFGGCTAPSFGGEIDVYLFQGVQRPRQL